MSPIPDYQTLMLPVLRFAAEGEMPWSRPFTSDGPLIAAAWCIIATAARNM